jgi:hypothetical protein
MPPRFCPLRLVLAISSVQTGVSAARGIGTREGVAAVQRLTPVTPTLERLLNATAPWRNAQSATVTAFGHAGVIGWFLGAMVRHPSVLPWSKAHQNMGTRYGSDCDQGQRRPGWACLTPM